MSVTIFTYIGVAVVCYGFVFGILPWLEGERK